MRLDTLFYYYELLVNSYGLGCGREVLHVTFQIKRLLHVLKLLHVLNSLCSGHLG
jgi:hypothetical protein